VYETTCIGSWADSVSARCNVKTCEVLLSDIRQRVLMKICLAASKIWFSVQKPLSYGILIKANLCYVDRREIKRIHH